MRATKACTAARSRGSDARLGERGRLPVDDPLSELATAGITLPELAAISKVVSGELMERCRQVALDILGPRALWHVDGDVAQGHYEQARAIR